MEHTFALLYPTYMEQAQASQNIPAGSAPAGTIDFLRGKGTAVTADEAPTQVRRNPTPPIAAQVAEVQEQPSLESRKNADSLVDSLRSRKGIRQLCKIVPAFCFETIYRWLTISLDLFSLGFSCFMTDRK